MSLRTRRHAYRAALFGGKKGEITKKHILGEDVEFKSNKKKREWWEWFRELTKVDKS